MNNILPMLLTKISKKTVRHVETFNKIASTKRFELIDDMSNIIAYIDFIYSLDTTVIINIKGYNAFKETDIEGLDSKIESITISVKVKKTAADIVALKHILHEFNFIDVDKMILNVL